MPAEQVTQMFESLPQSPQLLARISNGKATAVLRVAPWGELKCPSMNHIERRRIFEFSGDHRVPVHFVEFCVFVDSRRAPSYHLQKGIEMEASCQLTSIAVVPALVDLGYHAASYLSSIVSKNYGAVNWSLAGLFQNLGSLEK